jgi:hypothetical protein
MITLRNLILESALYEDDEATQRGWKHIAFGTYEDPSGKRYRRDDGGNWKEVGSDTTSTGTMGDYESRVSDLEGQGMTRSDAQGVADLEFEKKHGKGWETGGTSEKQSQIKSLADKYIDRRRIKMISDPKTRERTTTLTRVAQLESDESFSRAINDERLERVREDIGEMISLIDADNEGESAGEDFLRKLEKMASETGDDASRLRIEFEEGKMDVGGDRELAMSVRKAMMGVLGNHIKMASGGSNPKGYGY